MKLETLAKQYNYTCYWCRKKFILEDLSRDHIIPYSFLGKYRKGGGNSRKGKSILSCIFCNQKRGNRTMEAFKYELQKEKEIIKNQFLNNKECLSCHRYIFSKKEIQREICKECLKKSIYIKRTGSW